MTKHLIVAKFQENTDWTKQIKDFDIFIYNKGKGKAGIKLENVGREAHTYLHHIIENYDTLADVNVFTQGHPFDHCPDFIEKLANCDGDYYDFGVLNTKVRVEPHQITRRGAPVFEWVTAQFVLDMLGTIKHPPYQLYIKNNMPPILDVSHFGIFSVSRQIIKSHPIDVYQKLLQHTIEYENGAYTLELLWRTLFA